MSYNLIKRYTASLVSVTKSLFYLVLFFYILHQWACNVPAVYFSSTNVEANHKWPDHRIKKRRRNMLFQQTNLKGVRGLTSFSECRCDPAHVPTLHWLPCLFVLSLHNSLLRAANHG